MGKVCKDMPGSFLPALQRTWEIRKTQGEIPSTSPSLFPETYSCVVPLAPGIYTSLKNNLVARFIQANKPKKHFISSYQYTKSLVSYEAVVLPHFGFFHSAVCRPCIPLRTSTSCAVPQMTNVIVPYIVRHRKATAETLRSDWKRHGDVHRTTIRSQGNISRDVIVFGYPEKP